MVVILLMSEFTSAKYNEKRDFPMPEHLRSRLKVKHQHRELLEVVRTQNIMTRRVLWRETIILFVHLCGKQAS